MWTALVTRDGGAFETGARHIAESNLAPGGANASLSTGSEAVANTLEAEVQDLAARAARAKDWPTRARLTGTMLGTCATCHQATKGGPDATGSPDLPPGALLISEMHERYGALQQAREAIGLGDLKEARRQGDRIVTLEPPSGLPMSPWRPWVADVKARAHELAHAKRLTDAAEAAISVAEACGTCHRQVDGGPRVPDPDEVGANWTDDDRAWLVVLAGEGELTDEERARLVKRLLP
jgi:cytochrome c2